MTLWLAAAAWAGGTVEIDTLSVDGLELRDMSCELDKVPLLGPIMVGGALASQKDALAACGPEGHAFRVTWTWTDSTAAVVSEASDEGKKDCIQQAVDKIVPAMTGTCTAVILTGPLEPAEKARATLPARPQPR